MTSIIIVKVSFQMRPFQLDFCPVLFISKTRPTQIVVYILYI